MKRQRDNSGVVVIRSSSQFSFQDFADPLTEWLWGAAFTDVRALLAYHGTCRQLWRHYADRDLVRLKAQWEAKLAHHTQHGMNGAPHYLPVHTHSLLTCHVHLAAVNAMVTQSLRNVHRRYVARCEQKPHRNPFEMIHPLFPLHRLGFIPPKCKPDKTGKYGDYDRVTDACEFVLSLVDVWVKLRFGWDLFISESSDTRDTSYFESVSKGGILRLNGILAVGNAAFHDSQ
jgi:hypothetical protein